MMIVKIMSKTLWTKIGDYNDETIIKKAFTPTALGQEAKQAKGV